MVAAAFAGWRKGIAGCDAVSLFLRDATGRGLVFDIRCTSDVLAWGIVFPPRPLWLPFVLGMPPFPLRDVDGPASEVPSALVAVFLAAEGEPIVVDFPIRPLGGMVGL